MVSSHHPIKLAVRGRTSPTSYHQRNQQRGSVHPDAEPLVHHRGRFASAVGMRWQVVHAETQHRRFGSAGHVRPPQEYQRKYSIAGDAKNDSTVIALASHWHRTGIALSRQLNSNKPKVQASSFWHRSVPLFTCRERGNELGSTASTDF